MKKVTLIAAYVLGITQATIAQKVGIGTNLPNNMLEVVSTVTVSGNASILATNTGSTGSAIVGTSNAANTIGIIGTSANGIGVRGFSNNNIAISAFTSSGIALNAYSITGTALQVSGNLRLAGGNTNPSDGAVLTSDAIGNATWKKSNVAFLGLQTIQTGFVVDVFKKVEFVNESYDLQNNFEKYNGGVTVNSSTFTAPVAGVYHFSSSMYLKKAGAGISNFYFDNVQMKLVKNGVSIASFFNHPTLTPFTGSQVDLQIAGDFHLDANDKVWVEVMQSNSANTSEPISYTSARFSGHIVTAD